LRISWFYAYRTENSNTRRHLAEFWMIEPEIAFADLSDNAALAEALLKYTFAALLNERQEDLAFFDQRIEKGLVAKLEGIVGSEFMHMDYGEAIEVLERANEKFEFPVKWGIDLQSEHERYLTEKYAKKPVIVMNYPKDINAFKRAPVTARQVRPSSRERSFGGVSAVGEFRRPLIAADARLSALCQKTIDR
jgi:asparaginyl-tRNA synthetase